MKIRFIPKISIFDGIAFQTINYKKNIYLGDPINICNILAQQGCQEIIIACPQNTIEYDISSILSVCKSPVSIGGKLNLSQKDELISMGAEKIVVSDALWDADNSINDLSMKIGAQAVCASVDYIENKNGRFIVSRNNENKIVCSLEDGLKKISNVMFGELLLTNISRDGTRIGLDKEVLKIIPESMRNISTLISGGYNGESLSDYHDDLSGIVSCSYCYLRMPHEAVLVNYPAQYSVIG